MKKHIKYIAIVLLFIVIAILIVIANKKNIEASNNENFKIVTSFYPIYIMTANITDGAENIELVNMAEVNVGCVHNYTLTTKDMKKIENADVFIKNGLGLESFTEKITTSNKNLQIIDSSKKIVDVIQNEHETNPHIWTSISNYIIQVQNIAEELAKVNPENAQVYKTNSEKYVQELNQLQIKYNKELQHLNGVSAVSLNESFEYLGKDLELNLTTIHTSHEQSTLSAETLKKVIENMKQTETKIIIVDEDDNFKNAQTIANETGAKIYKLNSGVTGNLNKEAYIECMNSNLEILKNEQ